MVTKNTDSLDEGLLHRKPSESHTIGKNLDVPSSSTVNLPKFSAIQIIGQNDN
ncbi:MAG TPA: hypothetical protein VJ110_02725 [Candidatus Nanoarchaeia archaeon]|nr:hypothetical protein [Candidatus Nanoarchaeia archaeon]